MRPGRSLCIHRPTSKAIGIVQAMVNAPHDDPGTTCLVPAGSVSVGPSAGTASAGQRNANASLRTVSAWPAE